MKLSLKDKNGVILNTAKKYCEEDIEIKVNTEELNMSAIDNTQVKEGLFNKVTIKGTKKYLCRVVDYDGTVIKEEWLSIGDIFELPEPIKHNGLVFDGWVSPVPIINNTILVENQDIIIGPMYYTESGATELYVELNKKSTLTLDLHGHTTPKFDYIDWGDGTVNTELSHTYDMYDEYCIKIYGMTEIPYSWTYSYGGYTLEYCLKHLRISNTVTKLGDSCLDDCILLETITFPSTIVQMKYYNFNRSHKLKTIVVPYGVEEIQGLAANLSGLIALVLPYGLKTIKTYLATGAVGLEYLSLPDTIEEIGVGLLRYTYKVKRLHLPKSLKKVDETFQSISSLEEINGELPDNTDCDYNSMFGGSRLKIIPIPKNAKSLNSYCTKAQIRSIVFPDGVETVNSACVDCNYLEEAYVPDSVKILNGTFQNCYMLKNVRLPAYLEEIAGGCFWECHQLEELIIPSTLLALNGACLYETSSLRKIDFSQHTFVPTLGQKQNYINETCQIIVPDELYDEWIAATNWSAHADMIVKKSEAIDYVN